jgi:D-aminopeptidase
VRARELGIVLGELEPGALNAITDVEGVRVGHTTLIEGDDVRTGVTVVVPPDEPLFAGAHRLNGNGELTGLEWVRESGQLTTPVAITNTFSVGVVRDAIVAVKTRELWSLPVVGETWDGVLNDVNGFHVRPEHARAALESAADGAVAEGNVGGGTGMICHGFKGGIGTASRVVDGQTVGVLVQTNHGTRGRLTVAGVPVGRIIGPERVPLPPRRGTPEGAGSIVAVVATDAPLLPHQCRALALRSMLGVGRTGGAGEHSSGDFGLALSTQQADRLEPLTPERLDPLFYAVIEATEEAIVNSLLAAETMTGRGGATVHALEAGLLKEAMGLS